MTKKKVANGSGTSTRSNNRPPTARRPASPNIGQTIIDNGTTLVYTGRELWTHYPTFATEIELFAKMNGWGVRSETSGGQDFAGLNTDGDRMYRFHAKVTLSLGREAGLTKNGETSKAYAYRLVWDTSRTGLFELVRWHRRTSTAPAWTEFGSIAEIRAIIALHPVVRLSVPVQVASDE